MINLKIVASGQTMRARGLPVPDNPKAKCILNFKVITYQSYQCCRLRETENFGDVAVFWQLLDKPLLAHLCDLYASRTVSPHHGEMGKRQVSA